MGFNEFMSKFFGNKSQRDLRDILPYVDKIKAVYPEVEKMTNDELRAYSAKLRGQVAEAVKTDKRPTSSKPASKTLSSKSARNSGRR